MSLARLSVVSHLPMGEKLGRVRWLFVALLCLTAGVGALMLYSAANGNVQPWASRHCARFAVALVVMLAIALTDVRIWLRYAYVAYGIALGLLAAVEVAGSIGMGAQRWIDLGFVNLQPSELMKVALALALARYFHCATSEDAGRPLKLIPPLFMVAAPTVLVMKQPDLGTAMMVLIASGAVFFAAGVWLWMFGVVAACGLAAAPVAWQFLHQYQKQRVLTFLKPESDPLGSGYHILQSKIALGSGGLFGKGFMQGTQSHLNFLPEKQTDFIFTMLAEEWGLVGAIGLIALYVILIGYGFYVALASRSHFGRLLALGCTVNFFLYVFVNIAMVIGLIPVKGAPLPLVSWGGSAQLTVLIGYGLIFCVSIHREVKISRNMMGMEA